MASSETVIVRNGNGNGSNGRTPPITPTFTATQRPNETTCSTSTGPARRAGNPIADLLGFRTGGQDPAPPPLDPGAGFSRIQTRLIDRGLFLVLASHAVVAFPQGNWGLVLYSTDGLGIAMIFGALLLPEMRKHSRLAIGVSAYVVSWLAIYFWHPTPGTTGATIVKEAMFGSLVPMAFNSGTFPIVPWLGVYLVSSVFGERLAALYAQGSTRRLMTELLYLGLGSVAIVVGIEIVAWLGVFGGSRFNASALVRVGQKSPPAPAYLLFYCGAGLLLLCACLVAEQRQWFRRTFRHAVVCGETSLFVYFAHWYLLCLGSQVLARGGVARGFAYFAASTAILVIAAHVWQRRALNRVFTARYRPTPVRLLWLRLNAVPVMWVEQHAKH